MARPKNLEKFDRDLADLPPPARWREWMARVEVFIFAAATPVAREKLTELVGSTCNLDLLLDDIRHALRERPYELANVAGGLQLRTRRAHGDFLRAASTAGQSADLSRAEILVLTAIAYFQPVTRQNLGDILGREISRDTIAALRRAELIASGPRSPQQGAPYTYVTTEKFLSYWGFDSLRDLPDIQKLEDAGLLFKVPLNEELRRALGLPEQGEEHAGTGEGADSEREDFDGAALFDEGNDVEGGAQKTRMNGAKGLTAHRPSDDFKRSLRPAH